MNQNKSVMSPAHGFTVSRAHSARVPRDLGYSMPAEWEAHEATWLTWPHNPETWPGKMEPIPAVWVAMTKALQAGEKVRILVKDEPLKSEAERLLRAAGAIGTNVEFYVTPTDDSWTRDHGPIFVTRTTSRRQDAEAVPEATRTVDPAHEPRATAVVDWIYNCWGAKYEPYENDNRIPSKIAEWLGLPRFEPGIVLEGGSIEVNGKGLLLTSEQCLLHPNRNPHLQRAEIERYLMDYFGVQKILWMGDGIAGDDTDGHIDDIARFVNPNTILYVWEDDPSDDNFKPLADNLVRLKAMRTPDGTPFNLVPLPMPTPIFYEDRRLPASYANFYIANKTVLVPVFNDAKDREAVDIIGRLFPGRAIAQIPATDLVWGLGTCHCVTQQQPAS